MNLDADNYQILLVDDEKDLVEIGRAMLHRLGYQVTAITGSLQALEAFKQDPDGFDIILSDYNMPGLTGEQLALQIKSIREDIPIIVCTGFSNMFDQQRASAIGVCQILMKPMTMEAVALGLRDALDALP